MLPLASGQVVGAQAVLVDDQDRVLLQLRLWPPGWEPPGGHVGRSEDPAATVVREAEEETGLEIEIERLTGYYRFTGLRRDTDVVFRARAVGGRVRRSREAWRIEWFPADRLPRSLFPWYRQRIADALAPARLSPPERIQGVGPGEVARHGLALAVDLLGWARPGRARPASP
ncbi:MAG TPA: NUDIX domain-containing protein [Candidatus Dormibacteraeota bacterium]|nr:NUDIX domain-containing protein [Candidatus Dormibacteraeota bacterium]